MGDPLANLLEHHSIYSHVVLAFLIIASFIWRQIDARRVKKELHSTVQSQHEKLDDILGLINGDTADQKRMAMIRSRRIAELTGDPTDIALAKAAQLAYEEHEARRIRVEIAAAKQRSHHQHE